jgi:ERCC4-type nuclease
MTFQNIFSKSPSEKETPKPKILVDHREKNSLVISYLKELGYKIELKQLPVADYIINNTAIERKTISDLRSSIINKRIFQQLEEIKQYPQHFLIIEGLAHDNLIESKGVHSNALRGFLLTATLNYKIPIIYTYSENDTAKYIDVLARKKEKQETPIRATKTFFSDKEQLQFILEGFPNIGPVAAKALLKKFKSINKIANSSQNQLEEILGKKSESFYNLLHKKY